MFRAPISAPAPVGFSGLLLNRLQSHLEQAIPHIVQLKDQKLVFVLGASGAGKSSLINYLLGHQFSRNGRTIEITPESRRRNIPYAPIGNKLTEACTLYPEGYKAGEADDFLYVDTPGFFDTRQKEERITASITMRMVAKNARQLSGILVVIDSAALNGHERGAAFIDLFKQLIHMFSSPEEIVKSVLFVFTKDPELTHENVLHSLHNFLNYIASKKTELFRDIQTNTASDIGILQERLDFLFKFEMTLTFLLQNPEHLLAVNILDGGQTRNFIMDKLKNLPVITAIDYFNFSAYEATQVEFNNTIAVPIIEGLTYLKQLNELPEKIKIFYEEKEKLVKRLEETKEKLILAQHDVPAEHVQQQLHESFRQLQRDLNILQERIAGLNEEIREIRQNIALIDTDEPIFYQYAGDRLEYSPTIASRFKGLLNIFVSGASNLLEAGIQYVPYIGETLQRMVSSGRGITVDALLAKEQEFLYEGIPYNHKNVTKAGNGNFVHENVESHSGRYKGIYRWLITEYASAAVEIWVQKRFLPVNQLQIQQQNQKIMQRKNTLHGLEIQIEQINQQLQHNNAKQKVQQSLVEQNTQLRDMLTADIARLTQNLELVTTTLETENSALITAKTALRDNMAFYSVLLSIISLSGADSQLAQEYYDAFSAYLAKQQQEAVKPTSIYQFTPVN